MCIYVKRDREHEQDQEWGRGRKRRQNPKRASGSEGGVSTGPDRGWGA